MAIDSYRFLDFASRQVMMAWAARQEPGVIPFTPMAKPLPRLHGGARLDGGCGAQR